MQEAIYLADDEKNIRDVVRQFLESEGYLVSAFQDGESLWQAFQEKPCDLVILDIMMPGLSGFDICRKLREISTVPIIMLTARESDLDYATGINLGSDDYFTKPFSAISLVMRVKAILRRIAYEKQSPRSSSMRILSQGDLSLNLDSKTASLAGKSLDLTPNEYHLLAYLMEHQGKAVSRDELLNQVWGYNNDIETRAADDTVRRLRKKIISSNRMIETVWGFGFILKQRGDAPSEEK
jgi:DNA-binding response OmpR family regulator